MTMIEESIADREKLLALAAREQVVTAVASIVMFVVTTITIVLAPSIWAPAMTGFAFGWFARRYLRARLFVRTTTNMIVRLRGLNDAKALEQRLGELEGKATKP